MIPTKQNYSGYSVTLKAMENFCVSMSSHRPNSEVGFHSHEKPYLCLLLNGLYQERSSSDSAIIKTGISLFRGADHEHANQFYELGGTCLNIEINNPEALAEENNFRLPAGEFPRQGTIHFYKLIHSLESGLPEDLLNILCYEAVVMHFDLLPVKGKLDWIRKVKEWIHDNPSAPISLSRLSQEFGLHPNYIIRSTRRLRWRNK